MNDKDVLEYLLHGVTQGGEILPIDLRAMATAIQYTGQDRPYAMRVTNYLRRLANALETVLQEAIERYEDADTTAEPGS